MGKLYNNDEEYQDLIKTLRELPRIKAPDNFEYNLLVKIKNKNFETAEDYKRKVFTGWRVIPATALVFSVIILFFVFTNNNSENENPLLETPIPRENVTAVSDAGISGNLLEDDNKEVSEDKLVTTNREALADIPEDYNGLDEKKIYPFSKNKNVEIDAFLNGESLPRSEARGPVLVGHSRFNGFWIREQSNQKELQDMKAKFDSILRSNQNVKPKESK